MCSRGVYQLTKISLYFCDFGGSSSGVRNLLMSNKWKQFIKQNKRINFNFICKRNHHPYVEGVYLNGYEKDVPLRSLSDEEIFNKIFALRNELGRSSIKASGTRVYGAIKSVQGQWQPNLFNKYPLAEFEKVPTIPWAKIQKTEKLVIDKQILKQRDQTNRVLKLKRISDGNFISNKGTQI